MSSRGIYQDRLQEEEVPLELVQQVVRQQAQEQHIEAGHSTEAAAVVENMIEGDTAVEGIVEGDTAAEEEHILGQDRVVEGDIVVEGTVGAGTAEGDIEWEVHILEAVGIERCY